LGHLGKAAKPFVPDILNLLKDKTIDPGVRRNAAEALSNLGDAAQPLVPDIANLLKDKTVEPTVRRSAAEILSYLGEAAKPFMPDLLNLLKDKTVDPDVRDMAAQALGKIRKLELNEVVVVLNHGYEQDRQKFENFRFLTYFLSGGTDEVKTLLKWVGNPLSLPTQLNYEDGKKTLEVFGDAWTGSQGLDGLQQDLADKIATVTRMVAWKPQDISLLQTHYNNLKKGGYNQADIVQSAIANLTR
jgi:uncharacterized protein (UPF0147 family)